MVYNENKRPFQIFLDIYLGIVGLFALASLILVIGFELSPGQVSFLRGIVDFIIITYILQESIRWFYAANLREYARSRWIENLLAFLLLLNLLFPESLLSFIDIFFPNLTVLQVSIIYLSIVGITLVFVVLVKALRYNHLIARIKLHPGAIFALSFAFIILTGSLLLMLPKSVPGDKPLSYIDALFTSTSAVCVTGLVSVDTQYSFTGLGKTIILLLIQTGGLGVMTLTTFFTVVLAGGMSVKIRVVMKDLLSEESMVGVRRLLIRIALFTAVIEGIGALLLYYSIGGTFNYPDIPRLYSSVFHSVSAFCNAGFSIYSENLMKDFLQKNYFYPTVIMCLIILGGLGFTVLSNLVSYRPFRKIKAPQITVTSRIVLITTALLIFVGGLLIYLGDSYYYMPGLSWWEKFYHSIFQSVSTRTAGFNTVPIDKMAAPAVIIMIILMWIGASPGGTGGGIKTTTFTVCLLSLVSYLRGRERLVVFKRHIANDNIFRAFLILFTSLIVLGTGSLLLIWVEPDKSPIDLIFEATSALGTVGLSRNLTFHIGTGGKVILVLLMYIGRIGVLSFLLSFYKPPKEFNYTYPKENITVG